MSSSWPLAVPVTLETLAAVCEPAQEEGKALVLCGLPWGMMALEPQGLCFLPSLRVDCRCLFVALCAYGTLLRVLWSYIQEAPHHGAHLLNKGTWDGESPRQHSALCEHPKRMRGSLLLSVVMIYCGGGIIKGRFLYDDELSLAHLFKTSCSFWVVAME